MKFKRIRFERTGGFAGIRLAADIDMGKLPKGQKNEIIELLNKMDFEELQKKLAGRMPIPDEFVYSITITSDEQEYNVMAGESALTNDMQPLIEILEGIAKREMIKRKQSDR